MAILNTGDRRSAAHDFTYGGDGIASETSTPLSKADRLALIEAVDQWVEDNAASYNAAIPEPARTLLSAKQKAKVLRIVIHRRWEVG